MTWQEELRKLDESLASGSLSADEYRTRRDQILSSAVTSTEQQPQGDQGGNADSTQIIEPLSPPQGTPQQPAQPVQPQQAQQPEATQAVPPSAAGGERTQVVPNWQSQQPRPPQASPPAGFPQPQQQYQQPASPPAGFAGPQQQYQQQPWNAAQEDATPPWGGGDFPPIAPQGSSEWGVSQGPESFESESKSGAGRKVLFSVLGVVLLAGIGFAVWALFINGGNDNPQAQNPPANSQSQAPPQPTSSALPEPPAPKAVPADNESAIIDPPGQERNGGGAFNLEQLRTNQMLPESMVQALDDAGMTDGLLKTTRDGDATIGIYAIEVSNEDAAAAAAEEYGVIQQEGGIPEVRELSMQGVPVFGAGNASSDSVYRAVYVLYKRVVIIDVTGPNRDQLEPVFTDLLDEQINHAPPSTTGD
ncbi:flagellar basal body protein FliL [Prauserella sp. PE36]|uniref:Flagellar basal body protein FliL n=1 Tax=Prauserella endophytica TaxID=1592324 RepID=A0ABY2SBY6_9PSEU|nr:MULTISPECIES: flagellar basal body protein FliL [Prauserella]PXY34877.1 flagellar basal body protein FliL [Prauserella coralliicola]RBM19346.1 flagellar basal body protein FliL [Prauserella sp. PE36]TKG73403.1 flagellar basal body protein FliL [Prauserella endophytica]